MVRVNRGRLTDLVLVIDKDISLPFRRSVWLVGVEAVDSNPNPGEPRNDISLAILRSEGVAGGDKGVDPDDRGNVGFAAC